MCSDPVRQQEMNAVKRNVLLSQARVCLDFGGRLASTLDASVKVNASYSLEKLKHLAA